MRGRKRRLRLLGWELVEVWWGDLDRIDEIVDEISFLIDRSSNRLVAVNTSWTTEPGNSDRERTGGQG